MALGRLLVPAQARAVLLGRGLDYLCRTLHAHGRSTAVYRLPIKQAVNKNGEHRVLPSRLVRVGYVVT
jgi:hypothetical protein